MATINNLSDLRQSLKNGDHDRSIKEQLWIKIFGDRKKFQESIMSSKPKIPNTWNAIQYLDYHRAYGILKLRSLDDWAHPDDAYEYYKKKLPTTHGATQYDSPEEDQLMMINYREFCEDVTRLTTEIKNDINEFGVPELQSYIGAYTTMFFVLKRYRKEFYSTFYTFTENENNSLYQKSPLRHLLMFLIERRLNKLIPDSDTFKFGSTYFETFEYRKVAGDAIYDHLIEKYQSDMIACKFLA